MSVNLVNAWSVVSSLISDFSMAFSRLRCRAVVSKGRRCMNLRPYLDESRLVFACNAFEALVASCSRPGP